MKMKKLGLVIMSFCLFIASGNALAAARSDCKGKGAKKTCEYYKTECRRGRVFRILNEIGDFTNAVGRGPSYLDQKDRMQRRKLYEETKKNCAEKKKCMNKK
jgi:hypothetical protein